MLSKFKFSADAIGSIGGLIGAIGASIVAFQVLGVIDLKQNKATGYGLIIIGQIATGYAAGKSPVEISKETIDSIKDLDDV